MQQIPVFVGFFLDASRPHKDGSCLIKMNIYQKPNKKPSRTTFYATKEQWGRLHAPKLRDERLKELEKSLSALKESAENTIKVIVPFSFIAFREKFFRRDAKLSSAVDQKSSQAPASHLVTDWFKYAIDLFETNEQVATAGTYQTTMNSINRFKKNLLLHDVTQQFLISYEAHLRNENKSFTTISIYIRNLKAIINDAIAAKMFSKDNYPFYNYEIPSGSNVKKALKNDDIKRLLSYKPSKLEQQRDLDFWILIGTAAIIAFLIGWALH